MSRFDSMDLRLIRVLCSGWNLFIICKLLSHHLFNYSLTHSHTSDLFSSLFTSKTISLHRTLRVRKNLLKNFSLNFKRQIHPHLPAGRKLNIIFFSMQYASYKKRINLQEATAVFTNVRSNLVFVYCKRQCKRVRNSDKKIKKMLITFEREMED